MLGAARVILSTLAMLVGVFWMFIAGIWWEAGRPAGWPSYDLKIGPFHHTFKLPDGTGAQLAALKDQARKAQQRTVYIERASAQISRDAGLRESIAQERIRYVTRTIIREIPTYVTPAIDRAYPLPVGLVRVYDASALGLPVAQVPDPAGQPDDAPSPIIASAAASVFAANNGQCLATGERLTGLQDWVTAQAAAFNTPAR